MPCLLGIVFGFMPDLHPVRLFRLQTVGLHHPVGWIARKGNEVGRVRSILGIDGWRPIRRPQDVGRPQRGRRHRQVRDEGCLSPLPQTRAGFSQPGLGGIQVLDRPLVVAADLNFRRGRLQDRGRHETCDGHQQQDRHKRKTGVDVRTCVHRAITALACTGRRAGTGACPYESSTDPPQPVGDGPRAVPMDGTATPEGTGHSFSYQRQNEIQCKA